MEALELRLARSANWFYWIAGLSLLNVFAASTNFEFVLGSGFVQAAAAFGTGAQIAIDAAVIGSFALLGLLASRRHTWAFIVGMILYALDGAIYLVVQDYFPVIVHAFVLYVLYVGVRASMALNSVPAETRTMVMPHAGTGSNPAPGATPPTT